MSALLSFIGGSAFRMIWGEVTAWLNKKLEHAQELERMKMQDDLEAKRHDRDLARLKLQSELGIREIQIAGDVAVQKAEVDAWLQAVRDVGKQTGIRWLDAWNGCIRPLLATLAIAVVIAQIAANGFALSEWDRELVAAILGIYVADRSLMKRGK